MITLLNCKNYIKTIIKNKDVYFFFKPVNKPFILGNSKLDIDKL
jgi:hypothetical protein